METVQPQSWQPPMNRFWYTASPGAWALALAAWLILWAVLLATLIYGCTKNQYADVQQMYAQGFFASTNRNPIVKNSLGMPLLNAVLVAHSPQFWFALGYMLTHNAIARMAQSFELSRFALRRAALRVDRPQPPVQHHADGDQRGRASTLIQRPNFWLDTPSPFSLLLLSLTMVLHWLLSQSFFVLSVEEHHLSLGPPSEAPVTQSYGLGRSAFGLFLCLILTTLFITVLVVIGPQHHQRQMPIVATCSLAIAANSRLQEIEGQESEILVRRPLRYGVLPQANIVGDDGQAIGMGPARVGFSTAEVQSWVPGVLYE